MKKYLGVKDLEWPQYIGGRKNKWYFMVVLIVINITVLNKYTRSFSKESGTCFINQ